MTKRQPKPQARKSEGSERMFCPERRDDDDLAWYFELGKAPNLKWQPSHQRQRYRRIERALDGRGYTLCRYYTNRGYLGAVGGDAQVVLRTLRLEYQRYCARRAQWREEPDPFLVRPYWQLCRFARRFSPRHEIVSTVVEEDWDPPAHLRSHWVIREADHADLAIDPFFDWELETSTWGDVRVDPGTAREILSLWGGPTYPYATVRRLSDPAVIKALGDLTPAEKPGEVKTVSRTRISSKRPANLDDDNFDDDNFDDDNLDDDNLDDERLERLKKRELTRERRRDQIAEVRELRNEFPRFLEVLGIAGHALKPDEWGRRYLELDPQRPTTSVSEIADRVELDGKWVRAQLVRLGFGAASKFRAKLPTSWFRTTDGEAFWREVEAERKRRGIPANLQSRAARNGY